MGNEKDLLEISKKIEDLTRQENMLKVRKEHAPRIYKGLIWCLASLSIVVTIWFFDHLNWFVAIPWAVLALVVMWKPYKMKSYDVRRKKLREQKRELAAQLKELVKDRANFIRDLKQKSRESKEVIIEVSTMCSLWDWITGGYLYNKNALICPNCKSHNGLYNPENPIHYLCPNCHRRVDPPKLKAD